MRVFLVVVGLIALVVGGSYFYAQRHPGALPIQVQLQQFDGLKRQIHGIAEQAKNRLLPTTEQHHAAGKSRTASPKHSAPAAAAPSHPLQHPVTLYLTNGEVVTVELVRETPQDVVVNWEGGEVVFSRREIRQLVRGDRQPSAPQAGAASQSTAATAPNTVTLYLANGGVVTGELLHELPDELVLRWEFGEVRFPRRDIQRIVKGKQETNDTQMTLPWEGEHRQARWPYQQGVVVKLTKGSVVDAGITSITPETLVLTQTLSGGGQIEHTIARSDVEQLLFQPIRNERSAQIEENLKTVFPSMQWYEEGLFTIVTDSPPPAVKEYRRTIRELSTDFYLTFYPLLKERHPTVQQYVVIFDDWGRFMEYALSDGVPGWAVLGYFHPEDEVLYLFNTLGERFSTLLDEAFLGSARRAVDHAVDQVKGQVDSRYAEFVEGQGTEITKKVETAHASLRQLYGQITVDTLRHEMTHALFHNWQLQTIVLSTMREEDKEKAQKKREFLQATEVEKKRQLLTELLTQERTAEQPQLQAANSWVVEGLAAYLEPSPVGEPSREWLSTVQEAQRNQQLLPLEFLNAFRMGSFPRMADRAKLFAYGQSWALVHFLMHRHPDGFVRYLDRIAREKPAEGQDLEWLLQALGTELKPLEQEFTTYLAQFPPEDPFWLRQKQILLDLQADLRSF